MNPEHPPELDEPPVTAPRAGIAADRSSEEPADGPRLRPGEKVDLERQIAARTGWIYTVDINTPEGVELATEQEHLFHVWADRRERDAEARKAEHEATKAEHEAAGEAHRARGEPNRLQMQRRREGAFVTVMLLVTAAGVGMIAGGLTVDPLLFPAGAATLSGGVLGLRKLSPPPGPTRPEDELSV